MSLSLQGKQYYVWPMIKLELSGKNEDFGKFVFITMNLSGCPVIIFLTQAVMTLT